MGQAGTGKQAYVVLLCMLPVGCTCLTDRYVSSQIMRCAKSTGENKQKHFFHLVTEYMPTSYRVVRLGRGNGNKCGMAYYVWPVAGSLAGWEGWRRAVSCRIVWSYVLFFGSVQFFDDSVLGLNHWRILNQQRDRKTNKGEEDNTPPSHTFFYFLRDKTRKLIFELYILFVKYHMTYTWRTDCCTTLVHTYVPCAVELLQRKLTPWSRPAVVNTGHPGN